MNPMMHYIQNLSENETELWVPVIWNGILVDRYIISNHGRIFDTKKQRFISYSQDKDGYYRASIDIPGVGFKTIRVHRIELMSFDFNPNFEQLEVNHKDGVKTNLLLSNLEWMTGMDNTRHGWDNGLNINRGTNHPNSVYDDVTINIICNLLDQGYTNSEICNEFGITDKIQRMRFSGTISSIKLGKTHRDISSNYSFRENNKTYNRYSLEFAELVCMFLSDTNRHYTYKEIMDYLNIPNEDRGDFKIYINLLLQGRTAKTVTSKYILQKPIDIKCEYDYLKR